MSTLTIQEPAERRSTPRQLSLGTGEAGTFGVCGCDACALDLRLSVTKPVHFMGEVVVGPNRWRIGNLSDDESMVVTLVDGTAEPTVVWPGEWLPFTHDMAIVAPYGDRKAASVTVFFTPGFPGVSPTSPSGAVVCPAIGPRSDPILDPTALYFSVLACLCRPMLTEGPGARTPSSAEIASLLGLTPRAVDAHIDYLVDKFHVPTPATRAPGWKRNALIAHVRVRENIARFLRSAGRSQPGVGEGDRGSPEPTAVRRDGLTEGTPHPLLTPSTPGGEGR